MVAFDGSAGESLAAGVIFTLPALLLWGMEVNQLDVFTLASLGGLLGVFFMLPLRRFLISCDLLGAAVFAALSWTLYRVATRTSRPE